LKPHTKGEYSDIAKRAIERRQKGIKMALNREETEQIEEGRVSQRHPLEGHEYHKKSDEALIHIAKDAHAAAEAMKSHNTDAENKYRDQANDSATVRHYRKTNGMPEWYKKKYGHMKESFKPMDEPNYKNSIQARQKKADDDSIPFDGPYRKRTDVVTDKSGAKHGPMSIARNLAKQAMKKQASKMSVKEETEQVSEAEGSWRHEGPWKKIKPAGKDKSGAVHSPMSRVKHLAKMATKKQTDKMPVKEAIEESRKSKIVKDIVKKAKSKKNDGDTFQSEPVLGTTIVKND